MFQELITAIEPYFRNIWVQMSLLVIFATVQGYGGAWLAVRMLFRPRRPVKLLGLTIFPQGMIPRHREQLALAIGKAVGDELVSHDTIMAQLTGNDFLRKKIDAVVADHSQQLLRSDLPPLLEAVPAGLRPAVDDAIELMTAKLAVYIRDAIRSPESFAAIERFVNQQSDSFFSKRAGEIVDDKMAAELLAFADERVRSTLRSPALERNVGDFISKRLDGLLLAETPLGRMFTADAVSILKEKANEQIEPAIHQLTALAAAERTRMQIGALIKTEVHEYYENLPFFKKIFVSRENLLGEVDDLVNESLPRRIEEALKGDVFAAEARNFISSSIDDALAKPLPVVLGAIAPEQLERLKQQVSSAIVKILRSESTIAGINDYLSITLEKLRPHSLDAILQTLYPEGEEKLRNLLSKGLSQILSKERTIVAINEILDRQIRKILQRPIGKMSDHIPSEKVEEASSALSTAVMEAIEARLPDAIAEFDVAGIVREKIRTYPAEKLESLILGVAKQHLRTIELFGAGFGLAIGLVQAVQFYVYANWDILK
jgi:uncharacterized membrane protein YheB (UPF0754 family)